MASVLVVGSGGREHALGWKLHQSPEVSNMYFTGENAGLSEFAQSVDIAPTDAKNIARFVGEKAIDLTVVGPDRALETGVVDAVIAQGRRVFGPRRNAAQLESNKIWAHNRMEEWGVPCPDGQGFQDFDSADDYVRRKGALNVVLKANGLADGKGVFLPKDKQQASRWLRETMVERTLGVAGEQVLIQERLSGKEVSIFAVCNGDGTYVVLPICQDYKRRYDGDQGPNTGGMGAVAPAELLTQSTLNIIKNDIIYPTLIGMDKRGTPYLGVLYVGVMLTNDGPKVIEYNARFGDPEAQVLMPLITSDFFENLMSSVTRKPTRITIDPKLASASVALVSESYPYKSPDAYAVHGLEGTYDHVQVFHGNTKSTPNGVEVGSGRGLHVVGTGETISSALTHAYAAIGKQAIHFETMDHRKDIGSNLK